MKKNLLYLISKLDNVIMFNAVEINEEKEDKFILIDKINNKKIFLKENLDKEYEFLFVTRDIRKIKKQMKRIYENLKKENEERNIKIRI